MKVIRGSCFWEKDLQQSDDLFKQLVRMGRATFNWLCLQLHTYLGKDPAGHGQPLHPSKQVAVALYHLASGASYIVVGCVFGIAESTVMTVTRQVMDAILKHFKDSWMRMEELFQRKKGVPGFCLAIDGVHVPILQPPNDPWKSYVNRKGYASLAFQVMVDSKASI
ncbi:hypothetical protein BJ741DRAFT_532833 [Chytriomyces cf. hyalinus JEL632]|nr:hypothetical protein BJ741DRAFT_532833 [Chytriomyces cf. hyalinus JEL632]